MKKVIKLLFSLLLVVSIFSLAISCRPKKPDDDVIEDDFEYGYYPISKFNQSKHLFVIQNPGGSRIGRHIAISESAIQGLLNREVVEYYFDFEIIKDGVNSQTYWLENLAEYYDLTYDSLGFEELVSRYISASSDPGYILYSDEVDTSIGLDNTRSITAATNMASIRGWIPIVKDLEEQAISLGLSKKLDVSDKDEIWVFSNYKNEFDNSILIQQRPMELANYPMVPLRDYAVANKFFVFYEAGISGSATQFRTRVHEWGKPNSPLLGWGPGDEGGHISFASQYGQFPIPSDFSMNLSVFNADIFQKESHTQKNSFTPITPEAGKHYVSFVRSDGDNISVWANEFPLSKTDYASDRNSLFPMGWSIQPSLVDIAPGLLDIVYDKATSNDYFVAPVSGHGYMYPSNYPTSYREDWFKNFDHYMKKADLRTVEILDIGQGDVLKKDIINLYAKSDQVIGGIGLNGSRYAGGQGAIVWSDNGKPFVSARESLWTEQKELLTARVNSYHKDYTRIEGYSIINVHPWSHVYQDVEWVVDNFDDSIVVVSPDQLLDLISKNVAKNDKTSLDSSSEEIIIPVDPLHNKFLTSTEDWVGGSFSNGYLRIVNQATKTYTLPQEDNLSIQFNYIGTGTNTNITVSTTIDSVTKVLVNNLSVRASEGINVLNLVLDAFYNPSEYKGKEVILKIETTKDPIRIDEVITSRQETTDFTENLSSYYVGSYEKGGMVKVDNEMIMLDGSDGWTGLFNTNQNTGVTKVVDFPNEEFVSFALQVSSSNTGTDIKVILLVEGVVYDLTGGYQYISNSKVYNIVQVIEGIGGKKGLLIVSQKDSGLNNGIGEVAYIRTLSISKYSVNPSDNRFDVDLEDFEIGLGNVTLTPGYVVFSNNSSINKEYKFEAKEGLWKHYIDLYFQKAYSGTVTLKISLGENTIYNQELSISSTTHFDLIDVEDLIDNNLVTIEVIVKGEANVALDRFYVSKVWVYDVYNNQFETDEEDWVLESKSGWENNGIRKDSNWPRLQLTFALQGSVTGSKTYKLLDSKNQSIDFNTEFLSPGYVDIKISLKIDGETYLLYEALNTGGISTISLHLDEIESLNGIEYVDREVTLYLTYTQHEGAGAGDAYIWWIKTYTYEVLNYDPLNNTFEDGVEDFVYVTSTGWSNNGLSWDEAWKRLKLTYALQGTIEVSKSYTLPNSPYVKLEIDFEGGFNPGNITIEARFSDSTVKQIYNKTMPSTRSLIEINFTKAVGNYQLTNKEVELHITLTGVEGGAGDAFIWSFLTEVYDPSLEFDPYINNFTESVEDWITESFVGWDQNRIYKDPNWPRAQVTYAGEFGSVVISKTYTLPDTRYTTLTFELEGGANAGTIEIILNIGDTPHSIYLELIESSIHFIVIDLSQVLALTDVNYQNSEVTLTLILSRDVSNTGAADAWLWSFVTSTFLPEPPFVDVENNFTESVEDWITESFVGWDQNKIYKDPNWPRAQITYAGEFGSVRVSKTFTLQNTKNIIFTFDLEGGANAGTIEIILKVGSSEYIILLEDIASGRNNIVIDLSTTPTLSEVNYQNSEVTLILLLTREVSNTGAADAWLWSFKAVASN